MSEKGYIADDLKILEGLEAVRMRPGMYIGSTGIRGLHHILWEIVDNSVDEAANGYADEITVKLHADGSASVEDNGRGMPTDVNTKAKMSGVEVIFTKLHAGGKFDNENYAFRADFTASARRLLTLFPSGLKWRFTAVHSLKCALQAVTTRSAENGCAVFPNAP